MSETMIAGVSGEDGLRIAEVPVPTPGPGQVLVSVRAAGMNRADLNAARGAGVASKASLGRPIGMEWAGEIVETGPDVTGLKVGDRVMCSGSGGYSAYAVADAGRCLKLDTTGLGYDSAAVLPLALMTAHDALISNGQLPVGGTVLVQGASSAVGLATLQIARLRGATVVIGTSTSADKRARLSDFGATHVVDPKKEGWVEEVLSATDGIGVDTTVDMVSGPAVNTLMRATAVKGRIVNVGRLGGTRADFDFDLHAARRLAFIGVTFRSRSAQEISDIVERLRADHWGAIAAGELSLPIDRSFALSDAIAAHAHMAANAHFGKIVLIP